MRFARLLRLVPLALLAIPFAAYAVDQDTVGLLVKFLPSNLQGWVMILWAAAYYVIAPILKKMPAGTIASKVGSYITQDTLPPPPPGDAG